MKKVYKVAGHKFSIVMPDDYPAWNEMQNYEPFGYKSVIVTKCDESEQFGNVISMLYEKHKAISYYTHGQVASRDITRAGVVDFLMKLENFKIDRIHIEDRFGVNQE